jgi:hypothetical protein
MSQKIKKDILSCAKDCETSYHACVQSKEHESVCLMKNNQCACGCKVD